MDARLRTAAVRGDTALLYQLLEEDPFLIDESYANCEDKNVLHIAAMTGHGAFMRHILQSDSAAARDMCFARDRDGRNPIHLAAIHGILNVLELVEDYDELKQAALEKVDDGCTILHLCVKHNQLEALKLLVMIFRRVWRLVGAKNNDGMTILHMALMNNQNQRRHGIIVYLVEHVRYVLNMNDADGKTALDLYLEHETECDTEIIESFARSGAATSYALPSRFLENFEENRSAVMVVASIIATMAFQAMINPPGGVWQENLYEGPHPHLAGESVMAQTHPKQYSGLLFFNTGALILSLATILFHLISGVLVKRPFMRTMVLFTEFFAILGSVWLICVAYSYSFASIVPKSSKWHSQPATATAIVVLSVIFTPILCFIFVFYINKIAYRARSWLLEKRLNANQRH